MELVAISRALWRRRLVMLAGVLLALVIFIHGAYIVSSSGLEPRSRTVGLAARRILIDTPESLIGDAYSEDAESLVPRAYRLGNLLASDPSREELARAIGVPPEELQVAAPGVHVAGFPSTLAEAAVESAKLKSPYEVSFGEPTGLSILTLTAVAPDRQDASRLAQASIARLRALGAAEAKLGGEMTVESIVGRAAVTKTVGGGIAKPAIEGLVFFLVWCILVAFGDAIARKRRRPGRPTVLRTASEA